MKAFKLILIGAFIFSFQAFPQKGVEDGSKYGHGEDSVRCLKNLSLYMELVKQNKFDEAFPFWEIAFNECPTSNTRIYIDGVKIMNYKIKKASGADKKEELYNMLMKVYDQRMKYYGDHKQYGTPYIKGLKALDMLDFKKEDDEVKKEAYALLKESVDNLKEKSQPAVLAVFMTNTVALYKIGHLDAEAVVNNYTSTSDYLDAQMKNPKMARYKSVLEDIKNRVEQLFAQSGAADCETIERIFTPQLEGKKNDLDWLKRVSRLLARGMCEDAELLYQVSEYQHNIEPSSSSAYGLARMYLKAKDMDKAIEFYNEAIQLEEEKQQKSEYYYQLSLIYLSKENYPVARANSLKAIENNPGWGAPYLLIGKAYAQSAGNIGDNEFDHKTAYWAAVDKFIKAKATDPSVADEANDLIRLYKQHFPATNEIFFRNLKEGATYTVGGWIGERTAVRGK